MKLIDMMKQRVTVTKKIIQDEYDKIWKKCKDAYNGDHWVEGSPYHTINLIWATIMTETPALLFDVPKYTLKPTSSKMTEDLKLKNEALLNKIIRSKDMAFKQVIKNAILAAHMDLGIVEWGCNSKFIDNPNAGEPIMDMIPNPQTGQVMQIPMQDLDGNPITEPEKISKDDSFFIKRIKATDFGFDPSGEEIFKDLKWFWIRDYITKKKIMETYHVSSKSLEGVNYTIRGYEDIDKDKNNIEMKAELEGIEDNEDYHVIARYRLFDRTREELYTFCEGYDKFLDKEPLPESINIAVLRYNNKLGEFYQIPEIYPLIDPQKEIEIATNMIAEHMKKNSRNMWYDENLVEKNEVKKLEDPYTATFIPVKKNGQFAFGPIDMGPVDSTVYGNLKTQVDFFNQIAGMASSHRGGDAKSSTATAEMISDKYQGIRQKDKGMATRDFLIETGNGLLNCIQENLTMPMEIEVIGEDEKPKVIQYIPTIDKYSNFDAELDIRSFSAPNEELERAQWLSLLDIMSKAPHLFTNPVIAKETLLRHGVESKDLQKAIVQVAMEMMQQRMIEAEMGGGGKNQKGSPPASKQRGPAQGMAQLMGSQIGR